MGHPSFRRSKVHARQRVLGPLLVSLILLFSWTYGHSAVGASDEDVCVSGNGGSSVCEDSSANRPESVLETAPEAAASLMTPSEKSTTSDAKEAELSTLTAAEKKVVVYFFWGRGCPHCIEEKEMFAGMVKRFPLLTIKDFEVWYDSNNARLFAKMAKVYGIKAAGVPVTFIGEDVFTGFSKRVGEDIEKAVSGCSSRGCIDPAAKMEKAERKRSPQPPRVSSPPPAGSVAGTGGAGERKTLAVPLIGEVDPSSVSLPLITIAIAGMDSFNPCAFFILLSLLGLLVHARSRGKTLLIGCVFVFFSGMVYFLFMAAWLNLFLVMGHVSVITQVAAVVSLCIAAINIKDFFVFRQGVSLTIPESAKPRLFDRMRMLMKSTSLVSILVGTSVLAIAANSYELLCTAGFPMVFTRILTLNDLSTLSYYLYLMLYNVVYIVPLSVIVVVFSVGLGRRKLTEWQGRVLKLVSGVMMLGLGGVLLLRPSLLNNVSTSGLLLAGSLFVSALTIALTRRMMARDNSTGHGHL